MPASGGLVTGGACSGGVSAPGGGLLPRGTATAVGSTYPTGMPSCLVMCMKSIEISLVGDCFSYS